MEREFQSHTFEPIFDSKSKILILGTFPSVKSRENNFYYGHPQNRFWSVLAEILGTETPKSIPQKRQMLLENNIAIWDVVGSCEISNSADTSIKNVVPNDLGVIFENADIKSIYANGKTAEKLYNKYLLKQTGKEITALPSTSPANAAFSKERLFEAWKIIKEDLEK